jgi:beta-N-acetylhexosaminidase
MSDHFDGVGEMFFAGYAGVDPSAAGELIRRYHVGGIILFTRNIRGPDHAAEVCAELQRLRSEVSDSPLFIAVDQEGGCVARITEGITLFPGNMALAASGSEHYTRQAAEITAIELSALGINVNFAPVLDIGSNPRNPGVGARAFASDPRVVAGLGSATIEGMQNGGVLAAAKHFPGLGEALVDSHDELPLVNASADELESREFTPFRSAIDMGVSFIMTAHCAYPSLDDSLLPATLSERILSSVLRKRLGFEGIIITDCLEMLSIEKDFPAPQASLAAARAGATMLLICHTRDKQVAAIEAFAKVVGGDKISTETIESARAIIDSAKKKLQSQGATLNSVKPQKALSETIALDAVTIVKNVDSLLPLKADRFANLAVIVPAFDALTKVEEAAEPHKTLLAELKQRHEQVQYVRVPVQPSQVQMDDSLKACKKADMLLILTYNLHIYPSQGKLVELLLSLDTPAVVAAVRDPYDLMFAQKARALVATYGFRECSLKALVKVLFGEAEAKGKLPVDLGPPQS